MPAPPRPSCPLHPHRHSRESGNPGWRGGVGLPPHGRRASDLESRGDAAHHPPLTPLQPCHPPLALAPRRLYTSPMRNPTSACPGLPDAARGITQRSRNCPESGPPYPQNGSCWTKRIVSAADGFEADSFPKIEKLEQKLGVQSNRRSSPRPEGPSPRRETFAQPRHSRTSPAVIPAKAGIQGGGAGLPPQGRRASDQRPAPNPIKSPTPCRSHRRGPKSKQSPFLHFPASESAKKPSTILRS